MGGWQRAAERSGQRGEEAAARLHHRGWLRHHAEVPRLPAAADRGRGLSPVQEWLAGLRENQGRRGEEEAQHGVQALIIAAAAMVRGLGVLPGGSQNPVY